MEFAATIVGVVFDKLWSFTADKLKSLKGVGEDLKELRSTLSTIRDVLEDAEARQVKEKVLVSWLKELKDVAFDIDDVLDEIAAPGFKETVRKLSAIPKSIKSRLEMAKRIKEIRKRLDTISQEKDRYHLRVGAASEHSEAEGNRQTGSFVDKSEVYGRDEDKKRIIDFLLHKCNEKNFGVISIVGLGGLGKTTLARLVYNDDVQLSEHFKTKMWVYVSEKFDIKNVIALVVGELTKEKFEPSSMEMAEQELLEEIGGKRFLLVLDDVWNEDNEKWDRLGRLLKNGAMGSKVIVTTRSGEVADAMKSDEKLSLSLLPDDECWKLFEKHAFKSDYDNAKNRNLVFIGKEIVKKCGGLPLAAEAIGSTLYNKREETWRKVRDDETWTQFKDNNQILPALMLSYKHLSPLLKQCFAYCSIFPKGFEIEVRMLVQLWTAEGFVVDSSEGSWYVDQLMSRSLLEGDVIEEQFLRRDVKMHDMVHNLAQFIAGDECSIVDTTSGNNTDFPPNSRYASLVLHEVTPSTTRILSSGQKLRTLHLTAGEYSHILGDKDISQQVFETIVSDMQLLRALHFSGLSIKELPATITKLVHLRYLDLSYACGLESLPKTIGLLHNLQTLKLDNTAVVTLPKSIGDLVKLLTLEISSCYSLHSLPETIGKLKRLQYLNLSYVDDLQALPPTIGTLQCLQIMDLFSCPKLKELPESIGGLKNLVKLYLRHCSGLYSIPDTIGELERLQCLVLLYAQNLQALPPTIGTLQCLRTLDLSYCGKLKELPESIGGLRNLVNLLLKGCNSLYSLPDTIGKLERLQYLDLSSATNLQALPPTIDTLQCLQTLDLSSCEELKELPESIGGLKNLVNLYLRRCNSLYPLLDNLDKLGCMHNLQVLDMSYLYALKTLPESLCSLYNLQTLNVDGCDSLTSMPAGIGRLSQLRTLQKYVQGDGENCASLAELGTLMNLERHLWIKNLQNVKDVAEASAANLREKQRINSLGLEWDFDAHWNKKCYQGIDDFENKRKELIERVADMDGEHVKLLEGVLSSLQPHQKIESLWMKGYIGKRLPGWMMDLSYLRWLGLESSARCDNLQALEKLSCLEDLELRELPFMECLPRLGQLPRLRFLKLHKLPRVKRLGSKLYGGAGAFLALESLDLEMMLGLEEWSGNSISEEGEDFLPRLSTLVVRDCPKLRALPPTFFPSVNSLEMNVDDGLLLSYLERGAFPNLNHLEVYNCIDTKDESSMPEALVQRLRSVPSRRKDLKRSRWNHSELELEKMTLETLERIAIEIEKKLVVDPSSST